MNLEVNYLRNMIDVIDFINNSIINLIIRSNKKRSERIMNLENYYYFIISVTISIICSVVSYYCGTKKKVKEKVHVCARDEDLLEDMLKSDNISLYTVNSFTWATIFQNELLGNPSIRIKKLEILIRKMENETSEYLSTLDDCIKIWKNLHRKGSIQELSIYEYKNKSDSYYTIIGNTVVLTGLVYKDDTNNSETSIDYHPIYFGSKVYDGDEIIKRYKKHFELLLKESKKIY
ncbi:hypothetical protein IV49_GL002077 [Kandleria vitulina DSM 20405]|uniref:Uncharacterized protein n=2 Tax=Kandleria vitulina TaxID=1630 RepID=A0A0R2HM96_9FIRM|nr:hypothetical protein IV49_GL002077 [Kandleria vitulina DSM 20405]